MSYYSGKIYRLTALIITCYYHVYVKKTQVWLYVLDEAIKPSDVAMDILPRKGKQQ